MPEPPVDPALWEYLPVRQALAQRDISAVYQALKRYGLSQRDIGRLTGQGQSEVSEIFKGRTVLSYDVLVRIAEGLGVPRGYMGLAYDEETDAEVVSPVASGEEVDEAVKRRAALASAFAVVMGMPVLGEPPVIGFVPEPTPLPNRIGMSDVRVLRAVAASLRALGRAGHPGMPSLLGPVVGRGERLLARASAVSDDNKIVKSLGAALAELHTLTGWCCHDMHLGDRSRYHYDRAVKLAADAGDVIEMVSAVSHAAISEQELGAPNDALKLFQAAQFKLGEVPDGTRGKVEHQVWLPIRAARALVELDRPDLVRAELKWADRFPTLTDPFERADMDHTRAGIELRLGEIDAAEPYAASSVGTWGPDNRRDAVDAQVQLATIHTIAGESDTPELVRVAIDAVTELRSVRARALLLPLQETLETRTDTTLSDLAEQVRRLRLAA